MPKQRNKCEENNNLKLITPEVFARAVTTDFLEQQSDKWIIDFYQFLKGNPALYKSGAIDKNNPIIRTENGEHNWKCRSRVDGEWRDGVGIPLGEESEAYEVDILNGSTVVRTIEITSATASYSAVDQVVDFGSTQANININIYQLSAVVGRGYPASATI